MGKLIVSDYRCFLFTIYDIRFKQPIENLEFNREWAHFFTRIETN